LSAIAGHTAGPNGLKFIEETHGYPQGNNFYIRFFIIHGQRRALQLVNYERKTIKKMYRNIQCNYRNQSL